MSVGVAAEVFDFVDDLIDGLQEAVSSPEKLQEQESTAVTFCESLFEQFFGSLGHRIVGFSRASKRRASVYAELLGDGEATLHVRRMIVRYEELCDIRVDLASDYGGEEVSEVQKQFHTEFLVELLATVCSWAELEGMDDLSERARRAQEDYDGAVGRSQW